MKLGAAGLLREHRSIRLPVLGSLIGRIPLGVATVALLLGVQQSTGSTVSSGFVTAGATVGVAVGALVQGRMLDRLPRKRVLAGFGTVQVVSLCLLALATSMRTPLPELVVLAMLFGLSVPSLTASTRWMLRSVVPADELAQAFTLDTFLLQFIYVTGPSVAAFATSLAGPTPALVGCAACVLVGTALFLRTCDSALLVPAAKPVRDTPKSRSGPTKYIAVFLLGTSLVALSSGFLSLGITELATVRGTSLTAVGIAFSAMSVGSLVGGFTYGAVKWRVPLVAQYAVLAVGNAALLASLLALPPFPVLYVLIAVAGLFLSPLSSLATQTLDRLAPASAWMQTQGWGTVANTGGQTTGLAVGGVIAGTAGPVLAFACASGAVVLAAVVAAPALIRAGATIPARRPQPLATAALPREKT